MEYIIGAYSMDVQIAPLIKNRIESGHITGISVKGDGKYAEVTVGSRDKILLLAGLLADILVDNMKMHHMVSVIKRRYGHLSKKDRCDLLVETLKKLWCGAAGKDWKRQYIKSKVAICLLESDSQALMLDGVMRFRIRDEVEQWEKCLYCTEREIAERNEREEMIRLLRYYITTRESLIGFVSVDPAGEGGYVLHDSDGNEVAAPYDWEEECDRRASDVVLSYLIELSPASVDISQVKDKELRDVIAGVFTGRTKIQ